LRQASISTEADFEWFERYGSESNARAAVLVNAAEVIFTRDVSVTFQLATQHTWSTALQPYDTTDSNQLLTEFQNFTNAHGQLGVSDLHHLFSGKDFDDTVAGISFLGVVCSMPTAAYSTTQHVNDSFDYLFVAHELGHNFGAEHDTTTQPPTLMYPSVGPGQTSFSLISKNQINTYLTKYGGCLKKVSPSPANPTPTATPSGGGPSGGSGGINDQQFTLPKISLQITLTKKGAFSANGMLSGSLHTDCYSRVAAARGPGFRHSSTLAEFPGDAGSFRMENGAVERLLSGGRAAPVIFVRAEYICPSEGKRVYSLPSRILPSRIASKHKTASIFDWIDNLIENISSSAGQ
jgi:hypothetical protein